MIAIAFVIGLSVGACFGAVIMGACIGNARAGELRR